MSWTVVSAMTVHNGGDPEDIARSIREIGTKLSRDVTPAHQATIAAIAAVGTHLRNHELVTSAAMETLSRLAAQSRTAGHDDLASAALDAVVDVANSRLAVLIPDQRLNVLRASRRSARNSSKVALQQRLGIPIASQLPQVEDDGAEDPLTARWVQDHASQPIDSVKLGRLLDRTWPATEEPDREAPRLGRAATAHELIETTSHRLAALLPEPPTAGGLPVTWAEAETFTTDIERLGRLTKRLYTDGRYSHCDAVEEQLELAAVQLTHSARVEQWWPRDRTGWRRTHMPEVARPAAAVADLLRDLGIAAYEAGFDRRALVTARRLLSAVTVAARAGDVIGAQHDIEALYLLINRTALFPTDASEASDARAAVIVNGLVAESDAYLGTRLQNPAPDDGMDPFEFIPWQVKGHEYELAAALWRGWLRAAGWPETWRDHEVTPGPPPALPDVLRAKARDELNMHLRVDGPVYPAGFLFSLWADAIISTQSGDDKARSDFHTFLQSVLAEYDDWLDFQPDSDTVTEEDPDDDNDRQPRIRAIHPQLRQLIDAAIRWATATTPDATEKILVPVSADQKNLLSALSGYLQQPSAEQPSYHGLEDTNDGHLVVVQHADGSRRLLRDHEAGARGPFAWGYGGGGPHALAEILAHDVAGQYRWCPDCLGAITAAAGLVRCSLCNNSGQRPGMGKLVSLIETHVLYNLKPENAEQTPPTIPGATWSLTRSAMLTSALDHSARRRLLRLRSVPRKHPDGVARPANTVLNPVESTG